MNTLLPPACLAFQGGGALGMAHLGAWKVLAQRFRPLGVSGTSAGSIVAALCAAGYDPDSTINLFQSMEWPELVKPQSWLDLFRSRDGWSDGDRFYRWMQECLSAHLAHATHVNFETLYQKTNIYLGITACDLNDASASPVIFDRHREPRTNVAYAVRASISIPGFFVAVTRRELGQVLVDGGLLLNLPVELVEELAATHACPIFGMRFVHAVPPLDNPRVLEVVKRAMSVVITPGSLPPERLRLADNYIDVQIDVDGFDTLNFKLDEREKAELVERGRLAAERALLEYDQRSFRAQYQAATGIAPPANPAVPAPQTQAGGVQALPPALAPGEQVQGQPSTGTPERVAERAARPQWPPSYTRQFLLVALSERDLREIVADHFSAVHSDLGTKFSLREVVDVLVDYCYRTEQADRLIALAAKHNPNRYRTFLAGEAAGSSADT